MKSTIFKFLIFVSIFSIGALARDDDFDAEIDDIYSRKNL